MDLVTLLRMSAREANIHAAAGSVVNRIWNRGPKPDNRGLMKILPVGPNFFRGVWGYSPPENFENLFPEIG